MIRSLACVLFVCAGIALGFTTDYEDVSEEIPSTLIPTIISSTTFVEATIGETAQFPCEVINLGEFVLIWKKGKTILFAGDMRITRDDRISLDKTSLEISNIHPKDKGEYICYISTNPPLELSHGLDVLYPPSVKPHPKDGLVTVKEGESVTIKCDATGNPKPTVTWKHAGRHYDTDNASFQITNAQIENSGEYECIAINQVGEPASAVITVDVVSPPKVYPNPASGEVIVKEGEPIEIGCEATGDPTPVISWKKPGLDKTIKVREGNKIVISEADRSHAGEYECIANNSQGISTSAKITVHVEFPPEIEIPHPWIHAGEGTNVKLSCIIRGYPKPNMEWKKADGQTIGNDEHYLVTSLGHHHTLEIVNLREEDFGRYECLAKSGSEKRTENVHIIGTPQVPKFTSKPHGSQGTKYTLSWTVDSHTPVDEYSLMYRKKSSTGEWESKTVPASDTREGNVHVQMFQLMDLEPSTSYETVVTARNKFGWSKQSDAFVFTTKKEEIVPTTPSEETTVPPTVLELENDTPVTNDKNAETMTSLSSTYAFSLILLVPVAFVSFNRNLL